MTKNPKKLKTGLLSLEFLFVYLFLFILLSYKATFLQTVSDTYVNVRI